MGYGGKKEVLWRVPIRSSHNLPYLLWCFMSKQVLSGKGLYNILTDVLKASAFLMRDIVSAEEHASWSYLAMLISALKTSVHEQF